MSVDERLRVMEALWAELRGNSQELSSPAWHGQLPLDRGERVGSDQEEFLDRDVS
jgi:hypothetical protein